MKGDFIMFKLFGIRKYGDGSKIACVQDSTEDMSLEHLEIDELNERILKTNEKLMKNFQEILRNM